MDRKPQLFVTRPMLGPVEERLRADYEVAIRPKDDALTLADWREASRGAQGVLCIVTDNISAAVIDALADSVRIIATYSVGYNHIDVKAAARRGIVVTNTPDVLTDATADVAMLLLLGAARRAGEGEALMRRRAWKTWSLDFMLGTQVTGKRLGIVGLGRIGSAVAQRALGFGMSIHYLAARPKPTPGFAATHHADESGFWPCCDFLSLHLPLNAETRDFLNARRIAALPRGAIVANTARGEIVDDDALIAGLRSGQVGAAGLDVFTGEPDFRAEYAELPNTFLLPHLGSATRETRCAMGFRALDNLDAFFAGRTPRDVVSAVS